MSDDGLLAEFEKKIKDIFRNVNENTHPVGTKTWLHVWKGAEISVLAVLADTLEKPLREIIDSRPKISDEKYLKGIGSNREELRKHIQQLIDDDYDYWKEKKKLFFGGKQQ